MSCGSQLRARLDDRPKTWYGHTRVERAEKIELSWPAWKAGTQPIGHVRWNYNDLLSVVKEHTSTAARGRLDPYSPDAHLPDLSAVNTHWSGTPDSNRESHDPKSCGLSRFPSARRKAPAKIKRAGLSTGPVMRIQSTISYGATDRHEH